MRWYHSVPRRHRGGADGRAALAQRTAESRGFRPPLAIAVGTAEPRSLCAQRAWCYAPCAHRARTRHVLRQQGADGYARQA
jgi:hypothetical protein